LAAGRICGPIPNIFVPNFSYAYQIKEIKQGMADSRSIRKSPHDQNEVLK